MFPDLRTYLDRLRRDGDLVDIETPVSADLEAAEIHRRVIAAGGPALLFRNDQVSRNRSIRFHLTGTVSNRDAIGATVRIRRNGIVQSRLVKGGSSYLSQSELPVTFGLGSEDAVDRVEIVWPNGLVEEYANLDAGRGYACVEAEGITPLSGF